MHSYIWNQTTRVLGEDMTGSVWLGKRYSLTSSLLSGENRENWAWPWSGGCQTNKVYVYCLAHRLCLHRSINVLWGAERGQTALGSIRRMRWMYIFILTGHGDNGLGRSGSAGNSLGLQSSCLGWQRAPHWCLWLKIPLMLAFTATDDEVENCKIATIIHPRHDVRCKQAPKEE